MEMVFEPLKARTIQPIHKNFPNIWYSDFTWNHVVFYPCIMATIARFIMWHGIRDLCSRSGLESWTLEVYLSYSKFLVDMLNDFLLDLLLNTVVVGESIASLWVGWYSCNVLVVLVNCFSMYLASAFKCTPLSLLIASIPNIKAKKVFSLWVSCP